LTLVQPVAANLSGEPHHFPTNTYNEEREDNSHICGQSQQIVDEYGKPPNLVGTNDINSGSGIGDSQYQISVLPCNIPCDVSDNIRDYSQQPPNGSNKAGRMVEKAASQIEPKILVPTDGMDQNKQPKLMTTNTIATRSAEKLVDFRDQITDHKKSRVLASPGTPSDKKTKLGTSPILQIPSKPASKGIHARYKKMLSMGVPFEAVSHKMLKDGIDNDSITKFKKENENDRGNNTSKSPNKSQKNNITFKQAANLSRYRRMLSVGVPFESVVHKMMSDGVSNAEIDAFKEDHNTCTKLKEKENDDPSHKMTKDVCERKGDTNLDSKTTIEEAKALIENDSSVAKYMKMGTVGIPAQAVANKMRQDGVDKKKIAAFECVNGLAYCHSHRGSVPYEGKDDTNLGSKTTIEEAKALIENDSSVAKYMKMGTVGIPAQAVANKMRQDRVDKKKIAAFEFVNGLAYCHSHRGPVPKLSLPPPPLQTSSRRTSVAMQKIHWKPVSQERVGNSLWASATDSESAIDDSEVRELENLFGARKPNPVRKKGGSISSQKPKKEKVCLIDAKRSYNITISLAQFKAFKKFEDLCEAVICLDSSRLNGEQLQNMMALTPTQDEMRKMQGYNGTSDGLGRAESFFLSISKTPRFIPKLNTFIFVQQFPDNAKELLRTLVKLRSACKDIVSNQTLAGILKRLLAIGNLVNEGAGKPKAAGITMDSLLKTANKTGTDGKTRVIDVVVANFMKQDEEGASIAFWTELKSVNEAARINMHDCKNSLRDIQNGIKKVKVSVDSEENLEASTEKSEASSALFLERSKNFLTISTKISNDVETKVEEAERSFETLCMFFAEDPKSCKATEIFEVILNFSRIVQMSKETWTRKARAAKRRITMNSTPIKTSRSKAKDKPQSPKPPKPPCTSKPNENMSPTFEKNDREEMIKSLKQLTMTPRRRSTLQANNDHDPWE
jgi:hypothetical protein